MPYVNIRITKEGATPAQKLELIEGATDLLEHVLNKNPAITFVIIDEVETDSWGLNRLKLWPDCQRRGHRRCRRLPDRSETGRR
jgi:4-oxalocrotonate tautomerase